MLEKPFRITILLALHAVLGFFSTVSPMFATAWGALFLVGALYTIIKNANENNEAAYFAAYWVGIEIVMRMTHASLPYEAGKYGVIVFLLAGLYVEDKPFHFPRQFLVFMLVLLPALTVVNFPDLNRGRKDILFNLSGPMSLLVSAIYFYHRGFIRAHFNKLLVYFIFPIFALGIVLFFKTPDLESVTFTLNSTAKLSGGFGANQVSTILGVGVFIMAIALFFGYRISGNKIIDIGILVIFAIRGLLTFSRGGIFAAVGALLAALFVFAIYSNNRQLVRQIVVSTVLAGIVGFFTFSYTNELTGGFLGRRYANESTNKFRKKDFTTGRLDVLMDEIAAFEDYPILGAGVGMGKYYRLAHGKTMHASHTEFSRLLSEHGMYGLVALLILVISPFFYFFDANNDSKPFVAAFIVIAFLTMTHAAMRLAMPGFFYGLIFISLLPALEDDSVHRKQAQ